MKSLSWFIVWLCLFFSCVWGKLVLVMVCMMSLLFRVRIWVVIWLRKLVCLWLFVVWKVLKVVLVSV